MTTQYNPKIITDGLVLAVDAANFKSYTSGSSTWNDLSGNGNNGVLTNEPTFDSTNGGSIVLDGINDRIQFVSSNTLQIGTEDYSLEAWVNYTVLPGTQGTFGFVFRKGYSGLTEYDMGVGSASGDYAYRLSTAQGNGSSVTTYTSSAAISITTGSWYHFCVTRKGTTISHYMTGSLIGTTTGLSTIYSGSLDGAIGSAANGNNRTTGKIASVKIYKNKALTAEEVRQNYNATRIRFGV